MNTLKRFPIKYIRDKAKSAYKKDIECYVCGASESLDLHHVYSISELFNRWCRKEKVVIKTLDDILDYREKFIEQHHKEIYKDVRTLCKTHHKKLHSLFGQNPSLATGAKQVLWLDKLKEKLNGRSTAERS